MTKLASSAPDARQPEIDTAHDQKQEQKIGCVGNGRSAAPLDHTLAPQFVRKGCALEHTPGTAAPKLGAERPMPSLERKEESTDAR
jgi:hypothetical protein